MKKLAIILDSFTARTKQEIEMIDNFYYLSLQLTVDGTTYKSGDTNISETQMMKIVDQGEDVKTSLPTPADMSDLFEKLNKEYENIIYFPLSPSLSGTSNSAKVLSKQYANIHIIDSLMVGKGFLILSRKLMQLSDNGSDWKEIKDYAEAYVSRVQKTYILPKNTDSFIRSGRLGRITSTILSSIQAVPIISFDSHERLHKAGIKRSGKKAVNYVADRMLELKKNKELNNYDFLITHGNDEEFAKMAKDYLEAKGQKVIYELSAGLIIANVGEGTISISLVERV